MRRIAFLFVLTLVIGLVPAMADITTIGVPQINPSWSQGFNESGVGLFDEVMVAIVSGGPLEVNPPSDTFTGFSLPGWTKCCDSTTLADWRGPAIDNLTWTINFQGAQGSPLQF